MATNLDQYEKYGGGSTASLKGIVKLEKDENGKVGLEIPDLLTINNQEYQAGAETLGTNGNLCLLDDSADLLRVIKEIPLTYFKTIDVGELEMKYYRDPQGYLYLYLSNPDISRTMFPLEFVGNFDFENNSPLPISTAPNWNKDSVFKLSDVNQTIPLDSIGELVFQDMITSTIVVPKTVCNYFNQYGDMKNFSGTLDISHMNSITTERPFAFGTSLQNCTEGTVVVNEEQYEVFSSENRIQNGMLDENIKIRKAGTEGSS